MKKKKKYYLRDWIGISLTTSDDGNVFTDLLILCVCIFFIIE